VYISFGIIYYWKNTAVEPFVEAIERGRVRGEKDFGTTIYWLIDAVRHFGAEEASKVFRKAAELRPLYPSIVGIGIGGDEARGGADLFRECYAEAREAGLRLTAHAGETIGPESIWSAINGGEADSGRDQHYEQHSDGVLPKLRGASGEGLLRVGADGDAELGRPADVWEQSAGGVSAGV
jgi:hypothetical protein